MSPAPYVVGQWVRGERFYGRTALIDEVLLGPRDFLWLLGTRRVGKTSLLKELERLATEASPQIYFPVYWDFQGADRPEELHQGFKEAVLDVEDRLEALGIAAAELAGDDLFESLGRLRRRIRGTGLKLLLLCDEVEELIKLNQKDPALLRKLRRTIQSQDGQRSVLASSIKLWELADERGDTSPFLHGFVPPLYISRLTDDEAMALVRQTNLPADSRPRVDEVTALTICLHCDNHPYLLQLVGKRFLESGSIEDALSEVGADPMVSHFFEVDYEMLTPPEHRILSLLADTQANSRSIQEKIELGDPEMSSQLFRLEQLGYLRRNVERRYQLVNTFFRRWLSEKADPLARDGALNETIISQGVPLGTFDTRYTLLAEIGRGATGVVYKARDEELRETLAIKILLPQFTSIPESLERFRQEILLSRDLGHPNVLRVYHLGQCDSHRYVTMRWIDGVTLANLLSRDGALAPRRAVAIARKLLSALEAAHGRRVLHRDIKPQNVLLDKDDEPYLADFGLARLLDAPGSTRGGFFVGTPSYASPEQADLKPLDERSDLYAIGVLLFEMLTGHPPFRGDSVQAVLEMHRSVPPQDPCTISPEVSPPLGRIVLRTLDKDPARRPQNAAELMAALNAVPEGLGAAP